MAKKKASKEPQTPVIAFKGFDKDLKCRGYQFEVGKTYEHFGSSGNYARIGSSGDYAQIGSSGNSAQIGSSGDSAQIGSSGDYAQIGSSGDYAQIKADGKNAVIACAGSVEVFEVGEGGCVAIPYYDGKRTRFAVGYVGEGLKAGARYSVNSSGQFVEAR